MLVIGLTGISGSGKGYVCSLFNKHNIPSVDTDKIVHALYEKNEECIFEIRSCFGESVITDKGTVDRAALRNIVFSDKEKLLMLNHTVHKHTLAQADREISSYARKGYAAVVVDAPQLFESGYNEKCDIIISLICDTELRIKRICERDGITEQDAMLRISNQRSDSFFRDNSDYLITNNGEDVEIQVIKILEELNLK